MDCKQVRQALRLFFQNGQRRPEVASHLQGCPACQAWFRRARMAVRLFSSLARQPIPRSLTTKLRHRASPGAAPRTA